MSEELVEPVKTTIITRVETISDVEDVSDDGSDIAIVEYDVRSPAADVWTPITDTTLQLIEDLFITKNPDKQHVIQRRHPKASSAHQKATKTPAVEHVVLSANPLVNEFSDTNDENVFTERTELMKQLEELKVKTKTTKSNQKKKNVISSDIRLDIIPKTFEEVLEIICDLDSRLIQDETSKLFFAEETHNREIQFRNHEAYVSAFVPFVMREFWSHLKYSRKRDKPYKQMAYEMFVKDNHIICTHIRHNSLNESEFKFGQIVVLKYDHNTEHRFGFVREVIIDLIHRNNETNSDAIKELIDGQTDESNEFLLEKVLIYCHRLDDDFKTISVMPLTCVQKILMEARVCFELKEHFPSVLTQILKPVFKVGVTGVSINLEDRNDLFDIQKDAIQKAYEVCCFPIKDSSSFVAINGGRETGKTETLRELVLQLLKKADLKVKQILVIIDGNTQIESMVEFLKKNEIKVYHIDSSGVCLSHKNPDIKRVIRKLNKEMHFDDIPDINQSYDKILKYYNEDITIDELTVKDKFVKELIHLRVVEKLVTSCQVIIGSINDVMNDLRFNQIYNINADNNIECALIDNAHLLTETEVLTLLYAGVKGFVLYGDNLIKPVSYERCESFFQRYVRLFNKNYRQNDSKEYSVFQFRDTIEALKRLAKRKQNDRNFGRKSDSNLTEYRSRSNYGSEFFNRNTQRFSDVKPVFKTEKPFEIKNESKPFNTNNQRFRGRARGFGGRSRGGGGGGHYRGFNRPPHYNTQHGNSYYSNSDTSFGQMPNPMTDGIVPQMDPAFGNQYSQGSSQSHPHRDYNQTDYY